MGSARRPGRSAAATGRLSCSAGNATAPAGEHVDDERVITRPVQDFDFTPARTRCACSPLGRTGCWFKVNLTTDLACQIVETGDQQSGRFAFNCDIATPMRRRGGAVFAVDLFADVLVRADGVTYQVCDLGELDQAHRSGLILPAEARGARSGLAELTGIIEQGTCWRSCPGPAALAHWARRLPPLPAARLSLRFRCSV